MLLHSQPEAHSLLGRRPRGGWENFWPLLLLSVALCLTSAWIGLMRRHRLGPSWHQRLRPALGGGAGTPDLTMPQIHCFITTFQVFFMNVIKSNFNCVQEQEDSVLKSMKLKVVVLKIFRFGPKMVLVVKRLIWTKSTFTKNFSKLFSIWIRTGHA